MVRLAREKGIEVFIDGAHAFAHFPFKRDDLDCDYFGCSLHKWLLAPIGTGLPLRPQGQDQDDLAADGAPTRPSMRTSASTRRSARTRPPTTTPSARRWPSTAPSAPSGRSPACDILRDRWAKPLLAASPRVKVWTPLDDDSASGGIALVQIEGIDPGQARPTWDKHGIVVTPIGHKDFEGIRVTPNVYTTPDEIDVFVEIMQRIAEKGLS